MKLSDFGLCKPLDCTNLQQNDFTAAKNLSGALQSDGRPAIPRRTQQEQLQHWQRNRRMLIGAHQFKVSNGDCIFTEKLKFYEVNDKALDAKLIIFKKKRRKNY
ncbi:uncharacterized protein LOC110938790 [Helianthus annuus]|uniref:uncharacterized protein LOC110938790 n=1 Tax=Helianthus annuus TaxID=4232 RepID=UPI000B906E96|nr:uncharacterized protein LOC110938790 [Helianthus annuus]